MPKKTKNSPALAPGPRSIPKLLVANRSEIAIRVMRAASELGIRTVAVYANEDRFCPHRFKADEAYELDKEKGPLGAYLDIEGIIGIAKEKGCDAIHPGYGFLSENPELARACEREGILFIGPSPRVLEMMGDKTAARNVAEKLKIPTLPGTKEPVEGRKEALAVAKTVGFPLIIKAAFGGGGRGMRVVRKAEELEALLDEAQSEAKRAFGNGAVFLEKFVGRAKHIEVQILGDKHGNVLHLHERDCSVQRRHQKVIEQAPSHGIDQKIIDSLCDASLRIAREVGYTHAGTVEFLVDVESGEWFFIEMNPRIQVEHTVTEEVTKLDIVRCQILIARPRAARRRDGFAAPGRSSEIRFCDSMPHHDRGSRKQLHTRLRAHPHLPQRRRLRHPPRRRAGHHQRRHHTLLRLDAGEGHVARAHFPDGAPAHGSRPAGVPHPRREDEHPIPFERLEPRCLPQRPGHHAIY
jgi:pyruvate carboxylase